jgi:hypothetical protein
MIPTSPEEVWDDPPGMLTVKNPSRKGSSLHGVLAIGRKGDNIILVNYNWDEGPVVESILYPPPMHAVGNINRRAWKIRLASSI